MNTITKMIIFATILALIGSAFAAYPQITQVSYDPSPAVPGTTITFLVQIENTDSVAQNDITVEIENTYPFTVKTDEGSQNPKFVGNIQAHGKALVQFTLYVDATAENKTYTIPVIISGKDYTSGIKTSQNIIVSGKEPIVKVVSVTEDKLLPGEEKEITFTLQNVGTSPAYYVVLEMNEDRTVTATGSVVERDVTSLGAATTNVGTINPGEEKEAKLKISVNNTAIIKNYTLPITVSYNNQTGERTENTSYIGLKVFGTADIDATIKENTTGSITVEIFNKGLGKAEFTLVELETIGATIDKPKQFIGSLGANDVDTVKTNITYTRDTPELKVIISYLDSDAKQKTKEITLYPIAQTAAQEGPNWLMIIIVLAVIGFVAWKFVLNKKK
jgi:hypothetical protein